VFTDPFQRIRIINLVERTDRRREMVSELRRLGLSRDPRVAFQDAAKPAFPTPWRLIGEKGCFESHLSVLRDAAMAGESVLILEDDADFTRSAFSQYPSADIIWGGFTRRPNNGVEGAHCVGFSATVIPRLVAYLDVAARTPSPPPIDGAYSNFWRDNPDITVHLCSPMVSLQRPSFSDIAGRNGIDRYAFARPLVRVLRHIKRAWQRRSEASYKTDVHPY
jgi:glycosyl transferase, family 25